MGHLHFLILVWWKIKQKSRPHSFIWIQLLGDWLAFVWGVKNWTLAITFVSPFRIDTTKCLRTQIQNQNQPSPSFFTILYLPPSLFSFPSVSTSVFSFRHISCIIDRSWKKVWLICRNLVWLVDYNYLDKKKGRKKESYYFGMANCKLDLKKFS